MIGILSANVKFRRSLYFVKNIGAGEVITEEHVRSIRPGYGCLAPKYLEEIVGMRVVLSVKRGTPVIREIIKSVSKKIHLNEGTVKKL